MSSCTTKLKEASIRQSYDPKVLKSIQTQGSEQSLPLFVRVPDSALQVQEVHFERIFWLLLSEW